MRPSIPLLDRDDKGQARRERARATADIELEEGQGAGDDADELIEEEEEELVPISGEFCEACSGQVQYFAHEKCIKRMQEGEKTCPRCQHTKKTLNQILPEDDGTRFCEHINGGFTGSSKIKAVLKWYETVPEDDKVSSIRRMVFRVFQLIVCSLSFFFDRS
jgi:hypothetical protein